MKLSDEQQIAHNKLIDFITAKVPESLMYLLSGYAGTGKTFTLSQVVATLFAMFPGRFNIVMSAPTHKAVKVLKKMNTMGNKVQFATIHSLLGLQEDIENGKIVFKPSYDNGQEPRINNFNVVIIDESSMLNDEIFNYLLPYARRIKIIFTGDSHQIPPVGQKSSIPFDPVARAKHDIGLVSLENIVRQAAESPILAYATELRTKKTGGVEAEKYIRPGLEIIGKYNDDAIITKLESMFCNDEFHADADHAKVIAWTNKTVNLINDIVRKLIYKKDILPRLVVGDYIIMDKPYYTGTAKRAILNVNDELVVTALEVEGEGIQYYELDAAKNAKLSSKFVNYYIVTADTIDADGIKKTVYIKVIHDDSMADYDAACQMTAKTAKECAYSMRKQVWVTFYGLQKQFGQIKYNYAITAHKSQGSTYQTCMIFNWDIDGNFNASEREQIKYVAATRPAKNLIIIK